MNKKNLLVDKAKKLMEQAKQIDKDYQLKVGKFVINLYQKKQITDDNLTAKLAIILEDDIHYSDDINDSILGIKK